MPFLAKKRIVEGQHIRYTLNTGKSLVGATSLRIYYRILDRVTKAVILDDYWDDSDGVIVVDDTKLRVIQSNAIEGFYSVFPHAVLPTGAFVSRSADPAQFYVRKIHEL